MNELERTLAVRFGQEQVKSIPPRKEGDFPLLALSIQARSPITVVMTNGLSDYEMPVPEKIAGQEFLELYFCLPSYWDIEDIDNPRMNWIFHWIDRMTKHVIEKRTWFGIGHTIPCGNPAVSLSDTMRQNHFFLTSPIFLEKELSPLKVGEKEVNFLGIIPIFEDEMDYKAGKGTYKLFKKLNGQGISELLDDYRMSSLKSKWRFFKR